MRSRLFGNQQTDIEEYDEDLVRKLLERVMVYDDHLTFEFKSGIEINTIIDSITGSGAPSGASFFVYMVEFFTNPC